MNAAMDTIANGEWEFDSQSFDMVVNHTTVMVRVWDHDGSDYWYFASEAFKAAHPGYYPAVKYWDGDYIIAEGRCKY